MRMFTLFIVCALNASLIAAGPVVVETKLLRVEKDTLVIETNDGSTDIHKDTIKAIRIHNGKSEIKLLNDVVIILSNQRGKVDTAWTQLSPSRPKPTAKATRVTPRVKKRRTKMSASKVEAYINELKGLVSKARPGIESPREAGDVRSVEFTIRDLTKGKTRAASLREPPSVGRVRSLARVAPQRVAVRKRAIDERNEQLRSIQLEMRMLSQERQANQPYPTDSKYLLLKKQKRRSQIDRELKRLKEQDRNLRKTAQDEALRYKVLHEQSLL